MKWYFVTIELQRFFFYVGINMSSEVPSLLCESKIL